MIHSSYMQEALALAKQARYIAPPNPWVGCLIVKDHKIVGKGHTLTYGHSHAEICALNEAKELAKGATMYVTLEPCCHYGHTPPCIDAIIHAGIQEIYIAQQDPDPHVCGKGITQLQKAGIKIHVGLSEDEAKNDLLPYLHHRKTALPYTIIKMATSIDGRIADKDGLSQWITSLKAREDSHLIRAASQAIIIGSGTANKDQPQLTVRHPAIHLDKQPLRVILDSTGRTPAQGSLFDINLAPTLIITTEKASSQRRKEWEAKGVESTIVSSSKEGIDLKEAWKLLAQRGVLQALVEGGSVIQTQLIQLKLVNRLITYVGPRFIGVSGHPCFLENIPHLSQSYIFHLESIKSFEDSVRLDYSI